MKTATALHETLCIAYTALDPIDRLTLVDEYAENLHRIREDYMITDYLYDVIEPIDLEIDMPHNPEIYVEILTDYAANVRLNTWENHGEPCIACPTHCAVTE